MIWSWQFRGRKIISNASARSGWNIVRNFHACGGKTAYLCIKVTRAVGLNTNLRIAWEFLTVLIKLIRVLKNDRLLDTGKHCWGCFFAFLCRISRLRKICPICLFYVNNIGIDLFQFSGFYLKSSRIYSLLTLILRRCAYYDSPPRLLQLQPLLSSQF